jgi:hypothetical protein
MLLHSSRFPILGVNGGLLVCMFNGYYLLLLYLLSRVECLSPFCCSGAHLRKVVLFFVQLE